MSRQSVGLQQVCVRATAAALAIAVLVAITSCSTTTGASGVPRPPTAPPSSVGAAAGTSAAAAAAVKAVVVTKGLTAYAFHATQRLSGGTSVQQTLLTGRAIRPAAVYYQLTVGGKTEQVTKVGGRTFVRVPPAAWKVLPEPGAVVDPIASLIPLLSNLSRAALAGLILTGQVPAGVLTAAGLAPAGAPVSGFTPITFTLDDAGYVTSVRLHLAVRAGARTVALDEVTAFSSFNHVSAITAPAVT